MPNSAATATSAEEYLSCWRGPLEQRLRKAVGKALAEQSKDPCTAVALELLHGTSLEERAAAFPAAQAEQEDGPQDDFAGDAQVGCTASKNNETELRKLRDEIQSLQDEIQSLKNQSLKEKNQSLKQDESLKQDQLHNVDAEPAAEWGIAGWVNSLSLIEVVAEALKEPPGTAPFKYVLSLTLADLESKLEAVKLSGLAAPLWSAIEKLRGQSAATGAALNAKFAAEGDAFKGEMAGGSVSAAAPDHWTTAAWLESVGLAACVASSLLADEDMANQLGAMRTLGQKSEAELVALMQENGTLQRLAGRLRPKLQELAAEAPTESVEAEVMSKFSGQLELSYGGLDSFFGGLEARIGAPQPKVAEAMEAEHTAHAESKAPFRTSNYGIETTTEAEWLFVCAPDFDHALSRLGQPRWPVESSEIVRDRSRCRQPQPLERFVKAAEALNRELERTHQPAIIREEIIAARLYTGPLFEKYNAVLRGVSTSSPFLRSQLLRLCAPPGTHDEYQKGAKDEVDGAWSAALAQCQLFVTTLHGINSAVVKTGKLTKATKVYRGISGKALPAEFWKANEFGVMGGVENGFMSTTTDRGVAAGYAASGGVGIVFEVQQGMVDRGADISWLSQYPHEREILFGPLTGLEAQHKSVEGGVVVIHARLSVNLNALTLEAVISKKRKVLLDMGAAMRVEVRDQLVARGDGHYDAQGRPIKCHRSTMLPIVGERYEHQTDGYSLCAAEFGNVKKQVGYYDGPHADGPCWEPGRNEFVRVGVGPCWGAHAEEAAARGRLVEAAVRCLALGLPASWFNDDENFRQAVNTALELKRAVMASGLTHLELDLAPLWLLKELPAELSAVGALQSLKFVASDKFKALPSMAAPLRSGGQLRSLDLSGLEMGPANCVQLAQALSTATTLTALNLCGNRLCQGRTDRAAQLRWGAVCGPKIEMTGDGRIVTDIAANPKTGDDSGGRYRPCLAEQGFSSGVHRWGVRVLGRGRTHVGICTGKVTGEWREGSKRALHQIKEAWIVCPPSSGDKPCSAHRGTNKWHAGNYAATGLPPLPVGGKLEVLLDCEAHTVAFFVDGQAGDKEHLRAHMFLDLPAGETFFPAIAFGGDDVRGASFELCGYETIGLDLSGVEALAAALRGAASLTSVELHDSGLTDAAVAQLQEAAAVHKIKLECLEPFELLLPAVDSAVNSDDVLAWFTSLRDVPTGAKLVFEWEDQGHGNRKGVVFARRVDGDYEGQWVQVTETVAPHGKARVQVKLPAKVLGKTIELGYRVGDGGGHELHITGAKIVYTG